jgi:pyrroline-5-carboxylate reductase
MNIGLIGCGNMARALARGWGQPLVCADPVAERAQSLVAEVGGEALSSNSEVAERADLLVLCHKPAQLQAVAGEVAPQAKAIASILAATPLAALKDAYPNRPVYRFIPSLPVEVRQGAVVQAADTAQEESLDKAVSELFSQLGTLVVLDDGLVDVAMGLMSCAPAYVALVAEAQIDAGVRRGIPAAQGAELVVQTLTGTAELLRRRSNDTMAIRREVTSPGGVTARGLDASSAEASGRPSAMPSMPSSTPRRANDPRQRPHRRGRLPLGPHLRLHPADHRPHRHPAAFLRRSTTPIHAVQHRRHRLPA